MNPTFKSMLMTIHALDGRINPVTGMATETPKIEWGLDWTGTEFTRPMEDFQFRMVFGFSKNPVEIEFCNLIGRGMQVDIPLGMFPDKDLEMVCEEIQVALAERREKEDLDRRFE